LFSINLKNGLDTNQKKETTLWLDEMKMWKKRDGWGTGLSKKWGRWRNNGRRNEEGVKEKRKKKVTEQDDEKSEFMLQVDVQK